MGYHMPEYQVPTGTTREEVLGRDGLGGSAGAPGAGSRRALPAAPRALHRARMGHELGVIQSMGFAGYFLIVADFIAFARRKGIPVGPGRGSSAGSLVAYSLGITGVDPIEYDIIFERFLNPERVSMPDIDVDFCMRGRDEVIRYVAGKYDGERRRRGQTGRPDHHLRDPPGPRRHPGRGPRARHALRRRRPHREAGPGDPGHHPRAGPRAVAGAARARRGGWPGGQACWTRPASLEGVTRHASTHAAGVVIGTEPLIEIVPLYRDPRSGDVVTQLDMRCVEKVGLDQVRLPRAQDPDGDRRCRATHPRGGLPRVLHREDPPRRRAHLRPALPWRHRGRLPGGVRGHDRPGDQAQAAQPSRS